MKSQARQKIRKGVPPDRTGMTRFDEKCRAFIWEKMGQYYFPHEIRRMLKEQFNKVATVGTINKLRVRFSEEAEPAIAAARIAYHQTPFSDNPMSSRHWRLREILFIYTKLDSDRAYDRAMMAKLLQLGRAEMGEDFDKLATAIRDSARNNIVNIVNYEFSKDDIDRSIREFASAIPAGVPANRF